MAAPTDAAKREESSCQLGAVHTWRKAVSRKFTDWSVKKDAPRPAVSYDDPAESTKGLVRFEVQR